MNQDFEKSDLETIDYYFVACVECGAATQETADWPDAVALAKEKGYQIDDGVIYCRACADAEIDRLEGGE